MLVAVVHVAVLQVLVGVDTNHVWELARPALIDIWRAFTRINWVSFAVGKSEFSVDRVESRLTGGALSVGCKELKMAHPAESDAGSGQDECSVLELHFERN